MRKFDVSSMTANVLSRANRSDLTIVGTEVSVRPQDTKSARAGLRDLAGKVWGSLDNAANNTEYQTMRTVAEELQRLSAKLR